MQFTINDRYKLKEEGFILKRNILSSLEIEKIKKFILLNNEGKGGKDTLYPSNKFKILLKILKLDFKKLAGGTFFLNLKKKLELDNYANSYFAQKAELKMIDGYYNKKSNNVILPWHSDQAYSGAANIKKLNSPDYYFLKIFFYLTKVSSNNGCTSYIPFSHKITYAVRTCLYNKEIIYQPFWSINDLVGIIEKKENYEKIRNKLSDKDLLDNFLIIAKKCISDKSFSEHDFEADPGDVLIFNECGVHRGSNPIENDRIVLRYLYGKK